MISVAIPSFNAGAKITDCLNSVRSQTDIDHSQIEVLVVDDRSTDDTFSIVEKADVKHFQNDENIGLTGNWNRAVELAAGPIVVLLHQDDELAPNALRAALDQFKDPDVAMVAYSPIMRSEENEAPRPWMNCKTFSGTEYFDYLMQFKECPPPSCAFFRKDLVQEFPFYKNDFSYCPEFDLYLRLAKAGPKMKFIQDERILVIRGTSEDQFSVNNFYLGLIDKINILQQFKGDLSPDRAKESAQELVRTVDNGITRMLNEGWNKQVRALFKAPVARKWLLKHLFQMNSSIKVGLRKTIGR